MFIGTAISCTLTTQYFTRRFVVYARIMNLMRADCEHLSVIVPRLRKFLKDNVHPTARISRPLKDIQSLRVYITKHHTIARPSASFATCDCTQTWAEPKRAVRWLRPLHQIIFYNIYNNFPLSIYGRE